MGAIRAHLHKSSLGRPCLNRFKHTLLVARLRSLVLCFVRLCAVRTTAMGHYRLPRDSSVRRAGNNNPFSTMASGCRDLSSYWKDYSDSRKLWVGSVPGFNDTPRRALLLARLFASGYLQSMFNVPRRYAVGVLFIFHLVGFRRVEHRFTTFLHGCENPIRWTAGMMFSLYLYHYPLLAFLGLVLPGTPSDMIHRVGMICIPLLVIAGIAQVTERKKSAWRRVIDAMISAGLANINRRSYRTAFWTRKFTLDDPR